MAGEITATGGAQGLGTAVNGLVGGSCGAGLCQVSGGTAAGNNLFHRFSAFDTRGDINGVNFSTGGLPNVFLISNKTPQTGAGALAAVCCRCRQ